MQCALGPFHVEGLPTNQNRRLEHESPKAKAQESALLWLEGLVRADADGYSIGFLRCCTPGIVASSLLRSSQPGRIVDESGEVTNPVVGAEGTADSPTFAGKQIEDETCHGIDCTPLCVREPWCGGESSDVRRFGVARAAEDEHMSDICRRTSTRCGEIPSSPGPPKLKHVLRRNERL